MTQPPASAIEELQNERDYWKREAERLRASRDRLIDFMSTASDLLYETDAELRIVSGNRAVGGRRKSAGFARVDAAVSTAFTGKTLFEVIGDNPQMRAVVEAHRADTQARRPFRNMEYSVELPNGDVIWMESSGNPYFDANGNFMGYRGVTRDITRRKHDEAMIAFMVRHDNLTKLANRLHFRERIEEALSHARPGTHVAVLCLDLDRFKMVNDALGHASGDVLLRMTAERLSACVSPDDTVARLGGDEFAIVKRNLERPEDIVETARNIVTAVTQPCNIDGQQASVGISIGIAIAPGDGHKPDELLKHADIALYGAKVSDFGRWQFFEPQMAVKLETRRTQEAALRRALVRSEFEIFYQPLFNVHSRAIIALQALLYWRHPEDGLTGFESFQPFAEETGLIVPIGEWALRKACEDAREWSSSLRVAVSISPAQLTSPRLVNAVKDALSHSGLPGDRLEIEITEAALVQNAGNAVAALHELRGMGVRISMHEFGTGYSTLNYLRGFPLDKIRIDRSFIRDLSDAKGAPAVVRAIAGTGSSLCVATTAEDIETQEQLDKLRDAGCTEVQSYLFSRPVQASDVTELLKMQLLKSELAIVS